MCTAERAEEPDVAAARRALADLRVEAVQQLAALTRDHGVIVEAAESVATDDEHDPEGATIAFERAQVAALLADATRRVAEVDRALRALDEGTFGRCERCGDAIAAERLAVRPAARRCIACAGAVP
jgi:RNA polymerase-binding transcription factor DksA